MSDTENLPAIADETLQRAGLPSRMEMSPGLAIFFDDALYARCKNIAKLMSGASSMMPAHLRDKLEACFAVVSRAIVWKLDPFSVAMATYQTPGGSIGYLGTLIQAILERSGQLEGGVTFTHNGDWSKVKGKFRLQESQKGNKFPVPTWTPQDAADLSVTVSAQVKGETTPRTLTFDLIEAFPLNSPLWATAPSRQICYTAVRAFGNIACPGLLLGVPFDVDPNVMGGDEPMRDITLAKPQPSEFARSPERDSAELADWTAKANFANTLGELAQVRKDGLAALPAALHERFEETCDSRGRQIAANAPAQQEQEGYAQGENEAEGEEPVEDETEKEPPFHRGARLLGIIKVPGDVKDLMESIAEELKGKDLKLWRETCQARFTELGGTGKLKTTP